MSDGSLWQCLTCHNGFVWSGDDKAPTFCPHCRETTTLFPRATIDAVLAAFDVPLYNDDRFKEATTEARIAFWDSIRESYPEIETFVLDPHADYRFTQAVHEIVEQLIKQNTPPDDRITT